jgi:hypothetical protein
MKKAWLAFLLVVLLVTCVSEVSANSFDSPHFITLPEDSPYVGQYYATFCNLGQCWNDSGQFKSPLFGFFIETPHVHISFLQGPKGNLELGAKPGWQWVFKNDGLSGRSAWYLERQ